MRQPQLGGVLSNSLPVLTLHNPSTHRVYWRAEAALPWVCETCHPPAFERLVHERRDVDEGSR